MDQIQQAEEWARKAQTVASKGLADLMMTKVEREDLHEFIRNRLASMSSLEFQIVQDGDYISITHGQLGITDGHKGFRIHELDFTSQRTWDEIEGWLNI